MQHGLKKTNGLCKAELEEITILETRIKEFQLRLCGISEQPGEDIILKMVKTLAQLTNKEGREIEFDLYLYQINSRFI